MYATRTVYAVRQVGSDPIITLKLLWGRRDRPTRGPKPGLSLDAIVRAAIEIADADGLEALSMRRVAERLGAGTMSLYRHVPAKAELLDLMFDAAVGERAIPHEGDWRSRLEVFARDGMAVYQRHPWMLDVPMKRPPLGPNVMRSFDAMLEAVAGIGLRPSEMVAVVSLVGSYTAGAARVALESAEVSDERYWEDRMVFWEDFFDPARYPNITRVWEHGGYEDPEDEFGFGLQRVLDGIETLVAARAALPGS
jgi:AcrR family transcriptional regulator